MSHIVNPISGNIHPSPSRMGGAVNITFEPVDYRERFENKRQLLHDMVEDGDGFRRDEIYDLTLTAHKAVWQGSKERT